MRSDIKRLPGISTYIHHEGIGVKILGGIGNRILVRETARIAVDWSNVADIKMDLIHDIGIISRKSYKQKITLPQQMYSPYGDIIVSQPENDGFFIFTA